MNDSNNNAQAAPSTGLDGQSAGPAAGSTAQIDMSAASKEGAAQMDAFAPTSGPPSATAKIEAGATAKPHHEARPEPKPAETSRTEAAPAARGTALIVARPDIRAERPKAEPAKAAAAPSGIRFRTLAASIAVAALLGGGAGALANYGMARFTPASKPERPVNTALNQAVSRIDREIAQLRTGMDSSAKATSQQVAKIADRVDRAEKAQADASARLAKASDVLDRVERRLAATTPAPASPPAQPEVTGAVGETRIAAANSPAAEAKRSSSPVPTIDGWFIRDAMNGAALIQGRGLPIEVLPGDVIPGLGRIEQIKRQDGHWVVVTSRGLIVPR